MFGVCYVLEMGERIFIRILILILQDLISKLPKAANPSANPAAFRVATPDTTQDMMIDKQKLNNNGANLAGIIVTIP